MTGLTEFQDFRIRAGQLCPRSSRNAAFQGAVSAATNLPLVQDGDLLIPASLFGNKALGTLYFYACILAGLVVRVVNVRVTGGRK